MSINVSTTILNTPVLTNNSPNISIVLYGNLTGVLTECLAFNTLLKIQNDTAGFIN